MKFLTKILIAGTIVFAINAAATSAIDAPALAQISNIDNNQIMARNTNTVSYDVKLANACVSSGRNKTDCICVTRIFKHRMTLREYKTAVPLYAAEKSPERSAISAIKMTLNKSGIGDADINAIDALQRKLANSPHFDQICAEASTYFREND